MILLLVLDHLGRTLGAAQLAFDLHVVALLQVLRVASRRAEGDDAVPFGVVPECLVFMDVTDDYAERIDEQHGIRHGIAETVNDVRGPAFTLLFLLVAEGVEDLFELDVGAVWSLAGSQACLPGFARGSVPD